MRVTIRSVCLQNYSKRGAKNTNQGCETALWKNDNIFIESKKCYNINNYYLSINICFL